MEFTYEHVEYEVLEAGVYGAQLRAVTAGVGIHGEYLRFEWMALDEDGQPTDTLISGLCNPVLNDKSKLGAWVSAHLGRALNVGDTVKIEDCYGKKVMLTLAVGPRKDGQGQQNKVTAVSPMRRPSVKPQAPEGAAAF